MKCCRKKVMAWLLLELVLYEGETKDGVKY